MCFLYVTVRPASPPPGPVPLSGAAVMAFAMNIIQLSDKVRTGSCLSLLSSFENLFLLWVLSM